ncbi:MAG: nucleoside monophosphate kinase [Candidatus Gracilibacteria bacterium]|nr:nucleoside monophosphate kinase [Candidatus Gracilibacteria bacterium]
MNNPSENQTDSQMDLILFGMQGAGKGTVGKAIAEKYNLQTFEMGGELRRLAQESSELGQKVKEIIESGKLVGDDVVMEIVENFIRGLVEGANVLFDGIPRKVEQAKLLKDLLESLNRQFTAVLVDIKKETALTRLTTRRVCDTCKEVYPEAYKEPNCAKEDCGGTLIVRADDNTSAIETRLNTYETETVPAIELFGKNLVKIDGEPPIEEVRDLAFEKLDPIMGYTE